MSIYWPECRLPQAGEVSVVLRQQDALASSGAGRVAQLLVQVADQGIGVPSGSLETIFQPFSRAPNARESPMTGMGLGLFVCRSIVERHGGRMWAESPGPGKGKGTAVSLVLPAEGAGG
ncbi:MAG TPA: ATP-binding protein [Chloroflexota bacterium]|jgi:signal transduction histidine kinase